MRSSLCLTLTLSAALLAGCRPTPAPRAPAPAHAGHPVVDPSVVDALRRAHAEGRTLAPFAEARALRLEDAYALQRASTDARLAAGDTLVGYEVSFLDPASQARLGLHAPAWSPLFASMRVADGGAVETSVPGTLFGEVEVAFTIASRVDRVPTDLAVLRAQVASVHVAIELPLARFDAPPTGLDLIADGGGAHRFAMGPALPAERLGEETGPASLIYGSEVLLEEARGTPWEGLRWLVGTMVAEQRALEPGQVVLSGALGHPVRLEAPAAPTTLRASVAGLGEVAIELR